MHDLPPRPHFPMIPTCFFPHLQMWFHPGKTLCPARHKNKQRINKVKRHQKRKMTKWHFRRSRAVFMGHFPDGQKRPGIDEICSDRITEIFISHLLKWMGYISSYKIGHPNYLRNVNRAYNIIPVLPCLKLHFQVMLEVNKGTSHPPPPSLRCLEGAPWISSCSATSLFFRGGRRGRS